MPWPKGKKHSAEHITKRIATLTSKGTRRKKPTIIEGVEHWRCGTCKVPKIAAEFYEDGKTASGLSSVCRECHTAASIRTRDPENKRQRNAEHMRRARAGDREKFRERERSAGVKRRQQHPERVAARSAVNSALKRGDLVKPTHCEACGESKRLTGHHDDYSKPLVVRWLCYTCHGREHRTTEPKA